MEPPQPIVTALDEMDTEVHTAMQSLKGDALDEIIELLRDYEHRLTELGVPALEAHHLDTRAIQVFTEALESIRDMRWKLLALRASVEDQGDHPVLDSAEDLEMYLDRVL